MGTGAVGRNRRRRQRLTRALVTALAAMVVLAGCTSTVDPGRDDPTGSGSLFSGTPEATLTSPPPSLDVPPNRLTGWGPTYGELAVAEAAASRMSDRELVGHLFVAGFSGTRAPVDLVRRFHLGGVIVGTGNVRSVDQVRRVNARLLRVSHRPWPLVIGVDQEGGTVQRIGPPMTQFPDYMSIGAADDPDLATRVARASGDELRAAGFTLVYAPDADVTIGPADPTIRTRSAGGDAHLVSRMVSASLVGYRRSGIVAVAKHFPGHGSVTTNSHDALPHQAMTVRQLARRDFLPFGAAIHAQVPAVMVGHIALDHVDPKTPADLSAPDLDLLRDLLGFRGLITTDALDMAAIPARYPPGRAAVVALRAGVDQVLMPTRIGAAYRSVLAALHSGRLQRPQLEASVARAGGLMLHEAAVPVPRASVIGTHRSLSRAESSAALTLVAGACRGPYVGSSVSAVGHADLVAGFDAAARRAGVTVIRAHHGRAVRRATVVALVEDGPPRRKPDVAVSVLLPNVLGATTARTRLALYGSTGEAMDALVSVLTGRSDASGHLPLRVSGVQPPHCS